MILQHLPPDLLNFCLVVIFSLFIGLEQRRLHINLEPESIFGTDRTFTLTGILGFILYIISPHDLTPFLFGGFALTLLLSIYYFMKIKLKQLFGITSIVSGLITYCLAPLIYTQHAWLVLLIVVCLLVLTEIKDMLLAFSKKFDSDEFLTLAKFLVLAGVILPLLPDQPISAEINVSPYKMWLAIVVVSAISYLGYLLRKFVFPKAGLLLTAVLGGLYSSTATTVILARQSKENPAANSQTVPAILLATTMMYLRIFLVALFFNVQVAMALFPWFACFIIISVIIVFVFLKTGKKQEIQSGSNPLEKQANPLEFKTALVFGALFIFFAIITNYVVKLYGARGINGLAYIVGVTDIDPFIINLFQQKPGFETSITAIAVINAITSNNILKMIYSLVLSDKSFRVRLVIGFGALIVAGVASSLLFTLIH